MFYAREGAIRIEIPQRTNSTPPFTKDQLKYKYIDLKPLAQDNYENLGYERDRIPKKSIKR
ncbi:hypothetical protein [Candidatus Harpocratesius sp.]